MAAKICRVPRSSQVFDENILPCSSRTVTAVGVLSDKGNASRKKTFASYNIISKKSINCSEMKNNGRNNFYKAKLSNHQF